MLLPRPVAGVWRASTTASVRYRVVWRLALGAWSIVAALSQLARVNSGRPFPDAYTYYAAAQRLNVGHDLYRLVPGDAVIPLLPPYWSVPILSPPFMAVIWRPIAWLPYELAAAIWVGFMSVVMIWATYKVFERAPAAVALAAPGLGYLLGSGNVHGFLFVALVCAWLWRGRTWTAALLGVMTAAKVMPLVFAPWFKSGGLRSILAFIGAGAVCGLIGIVGAGLGSTLQYPGIIMSSAPQPVSLSYLFGISWLSMALTIAGMILTIALKGARAYQMAIITLVLFNPSGIGLAGGSLLVLLALPHIGEHPGDGEIDNGRPPGEPEHGRARRIEYAITLTLITVIGIMAYSFSVGG